MGNGQGKWERERGEICNFQKRHVLTYYMPFLERIPCDYHGELLGCVQLNVELQYYIIDVISRSMGKM